MPTPVFIDLSHHNTIPESLEETKAAGILGVVHKATEGTTFVDDRLNARHYMAQQAGMLWGVYHFIRPGEIAGQAKFFIDTISEVSDENTLLCLDWEDDEVSVDDAVLFMELVEEYTGRAPVLYSGHVVKEALGGEPDERINRFRLWLCQYTTGEPDLPAGWDAYWAWQYTDKGEVPGVSPPTDLNAYGGEADLADDWSGAGGVLRPEPEPEPEPDEIEISVIVPPGVSVKVITRK